MVKMSKKEREETEKEREETEKLIQDIKKQTKEIGVNIKRITLLIMIIGLISASLGVIFCIKDFSIPNITFILFGASCLFFGREEWIRSSDVSVWGG